MMQTQWPGLGPMLDAASLDAPAAGGPALWPNDIAPGATTVPPPSDAIARSWWSCGTANANAASPFASLLGNGASGGSLFGLVSGIVTALQQIVGALLNQATAPNGTPPNGAPPNGPCNGGGAPPAPWPGGREQRFRDVDVTSTGDPHIAEVGTTAGPGGGRAVNERWDSMKPHDDLVHTDQIEGGYRVSTAVTPPGAGGVTFNDSASVHANFGQDEITMSRDGSYRVFDDGRAVVLGTGESATLSGGERVDVNRDGSVTVNAANGAATIVTTLRSTGNGVDVTTHGHDIALGGDAIAHRPRGTAPAPVPVPAPAL